MLAAGTAAITATDTTGMKRPRAHQPPLPTHDALSNNYTLNPPTTLGARSKLHNLDTTGRGELVGVAESAAALKPQRKDEDNEVLTSPN